MNSIGNRTTSSLEDYLEAIIMVKEQDHKATVTALSKLLGVKLEIDACDFSDQALAIANADADALERPDIPHAAVQYDAGPAVPGTATRHDIAHDRAIKAASRVHNKYLSSTGLG